MKVVHVPRRFVKDSWGGTETVILETCRQLAVKGHRAKVVCPSPLSVPGHDMIGDVQVERHGYVYPWFGLSAEARLSYDHKGGNLFSFQLMRALKQEPSLDIIHLHTAKRLGGIVRHVARQKKIPYVVSVHGGLLDVPTAEAESWTEPSRGKVEWGKLLGWWVGSRRVFDDAAAILCVGAEEQRLTAEKYPTRKVLHLPNGVDPEHFGKGDGDAFRTKYSIDKSAHLFLVMGRIDPQKNQILAVTALREVLTTHPSAHLLLVGHVTNQAYERKLGDLLEKEQLRGRVTLVPGIPSGSPDLVNAYHAADTFLLPSIHEPFGIVILEAWAAGLPVIASRVGGIPSFVEDDVDGMLFESNDIAGLVTRMKSMIEHEEKAADIALAGRRKAVTTYSWSRVTDMLLEIYEEAIRENPLRQ